jgi:hypothetical protein
VYERFNRSQGYFHDFGNLLVRQFFVFIQGKGYALFFRKMVDSTMQQITSLPVGNAMVGLIVAVFRNFAVPVFASCKSFFQRLKKAFPLFVANMIQLAVGRNPV